MEGPHVTSPNLRAMKKTIGTNTEPLGVAGAEPVHEIILKADINNTGIVYVGGGTVSSTGANGFALGAGEAIQGLRVNDLGVVFVAGSVAGQIIWVMWTGPMRQEV